jgi:hypothetical protein
MTADHAPQIRALSGTDMTVAMENLVGVVFEYSPDCRRLRMRLPAGATGVVVDLSRTAALDLADKVNARAAGMADPVVPAQQRALRPPTEPA